MSLETLSYLLYFLPSRTNTMFLSIFWLWTRHCTVAKIFHQIYIDNKPGVRPLSCRCYFDTMRRGTPLLVVSSFPFWHGKGVHPRRVVISILMWQGGAYPSWSYRPCHFDTASGVHPPRRVRVLLSISTRPEGIHPSWPCHCHFDTTRRGTPFPVALFFQIWCGMPLVTFFRCG